jgi:glucokinase
LPTIVVADVGATHARFALADLGGGGLPALRDERVFATSSLPGLEAAWDAYGAALGGSLPKAAAFALATPLTPGLLRFTNGPWVVDPAQLPGRLGIAPPLILNDVQAMGHAMRPLGAAAMVPLCGPAGDTLPAGPLTVIAAGTGLGIALAVPAPAGDISVATEASHISLAPRDEADLPLWRAVIAAHGRASIERVVSGPGLRTLVSAYHPDQPLPDDATLWQQALDGSSAPARAALERWWGWIGSFAGDMVLAHGSSGVILAGSLSGRTATALGATLFSQHFVAKGRYQRILEATPVWQCLHPQPGLLGAAVAYAKRHA